MMAVFHLICSADALRINHSGIAMESEPSARADGSATREAKVDELIHLTPVLAFSHHLRLFVMPAFRVRLLSLRHLLRGELNQILVMNLGQKLNPDEYFLKTCLR
jgi:hypothetical protein